MSVRKLSKEAWSFEVQRAMKMRENNREKLRAAKWAYYERVVGRLMPIPYLIGAGAAIALLLMYGWAEFLKFFLGWIVSLTIIASGAYHLWKYYERRLD